MSFKQNYLNFLAQTNQLNIMNINKYLLLPATVLIFACNNPSKQASTSTNQTTEKSTEASSAVKVSFKDEKLNLIYANYLKLKDALVVTNFKETASAAQTLEESLSNFDKNLMASTSKIANAKDIITQRKAFTKLSNDMIALIKKSELTSGTVFVQHCPMANEGDGGDWLAAEKKIQNPYYGSEMMECGAVLEEIKPTKK